MARRRAPFLLGLLFCLVALLAAGCGDGGRGGDADGTPAANETSGTPSGTVARPDGQPTRPPVTPAEDVLSPVSSATGQLDAALRVLEARVRVAETLAERDVPTRVAGTVPLGGSGPDWLQQCCSVELARARDMLDQLDGALRDARATYAEANDGEGETAADEMATELANVRTALEALADAADPASGTGALAEVMSAFDVFRDALDRAEACCGTTGGSE